MEHNIMDLYPEYLKNFEDIKNINDALNSIIQGYITQTNRLFRELKMETNVQVIWNDMITPELSENQTVERIRKFHGVYPCITSEVLFDLLSCYMSEKKFTASFDYDALTVKIQTSYSENDIEKRMKYIRAVVPCNMAIVIEYV